MQVFGLPEESKWMINLQSAAGVTTDLLTDSAHSHNFIVPLDRLLGLSHDLSFYFRTIVNLWRWKQWSVISWISLKYVCCCSKFDTTFIDCNDAVLINWKLSKFREYIRSLDISIFLIYYNSIDIFHYAYVGLNKVMGEYNAGSWTFLNFQSNYQVLSLCRNLEMCTYKISEIHIYKNKTTNRTHL